jgi:hypothetical protein
MRLGALAAIIGCASTATRRGGGGSPLDRLVLLVLSAFVASLLWGLCAALWLARAAGTRWDALDALVRGLERPEGALRWCPASMKRDGGALSHGALVRTSAGEWTFIERGERPRVALGSEPPVLGDRGLGWGAALLGAPCEPLCFGAAIVYVDRVQLVLDEASSRSAARVAKVAR